MPTKLQQEEQKIFIFNVKKEIIWKEKENEEEEVKKLCGKTCLCMYIFIYFVPYDVLAVCCCMYITIFVLYNAT